MNSFDDLCNVLQKEISKHGMECQLCRKQQNLLEIELNSKSRVEVYAEKDDKVRFELIMDGKKNETFRDLNYPAAVDLLLSFMNSENALESLIHYKRLINGVRWVMFFIIWVLGFFFLLSFLRSGFMQITGQEEWGDGVTSVIIVVLLILSGAASAALSILLSNPYRDLDAPLPLGFRIAGYVVGGLVLMGGCLSAYTIWGVQKPNLSFFWNIILASCISVPLLGGIHVILMMLRRRGDKKDKNEKKRRNH